MTAWRRLINQTCEGVAVGSHLAASLRLLVPLEQVTEGSCLPPSTFLS